MNTYYQQFWQKELVQVNGFIKNKQPWRAIGIYGVGIGKFTQLVAKQANSNIRVEIIDLRELPPPSVHDFLCCMLSRLENKTSVVNPKHSNEPCHNSEFTLYYQLRERIMKIKKPVCFVILEAEKLLPLPDSFWDSLVELHTASSGHFNFALLGEPVIHEKLPAPLHSYVKGNDVILAPYDKKTTYAEIEELLPTLTQLRPTVKSFIHKYSQGHHGLIKLMANWSRKHSQAPFNQRSYEIIIQSHPLTKVWFKRVFDSLSSVQQEVLLLIINNMGSKVNKSYANVVKRLHRLGLVKSRNKQLVFAFPHQQELVKELWQSKKQAPQWEVKKGKVYYQGLAVTDMFTTQEITVLQTLMSHQEETVSYRELGAELWPEDFDEKYSLWAISKVVSRLRQRLRQLGVTQAIKTVRGRGYLWLSN